MPENKKNDAADPAILIKKYANRRLYNTDLSAYVTLDDLAQMVKEEIQFVVQDAKTGEDITRTVLTQIIFDAENNGQTLLPTSFLREIIRMYGDSMQGFVPSYLEQAMANFMEYQDEMRSSFENAMSTNPAFAGFEQLSKVNQDWMDNAMRMFSSVNPMMPAPTRNTDASNNEELRELKTQLQEMQNKLSKLVDK